MINSKILIPVDGSDFSLEVAPHIMRFLHPQDTEVVLLHVASEIGVEPLATAADPEEMTVFGQTAASIAGGFATAMEPHVRQLTRAGFTVRTAVRYGEPIFEIERFIAEEHIDLVAMATHGRTGLARVLLGSVAQHIVNHAAVPVLLYRALVRAERNAATLPLMDAPAGRLTLRGKTLR